jgi:hypothetical protein
MALELLPYDILLSILSLLGPKEIFNLRKVRLKLL